MVLKDQLWDIFSNENVGKYRHAKVWDLKGYVFRDGDPLDITMVINIDFFLAGLRSHNLIDTVKYYIEQQFVRLLFGEEEDTVIWVAVDVPDAHEQVKFVQLVQIF